jgi:hypothetical protein
VSEEKTIREVASMGGKARAEQLTAEQRRAIAKKAAEARWKKKRSQKEEK